MHCFDGKCRQLNPVDYGWTLDDGVLKQLWYTGSALPNDHEVIQLTEGGEVEEQQEPAGEDYLSSEAIDYYNQIQNRDRG